MSVDRIQRNVAAQIIVAYMRGEIDHLDAGVRLTEISESNDQLRRQGAERDRYLDSINNSFHYPLHSFDEWHWEHLRRELAFLQSELEQVDPPPPSPAEAEAKREAVDRWLAVLHLTLIAIAVGVAIWIGWWGVWIPVIVTAGSYWIFSRRESPTLPRDHDPQEEDQGEPYSCGPFASQEQWLEHEPLLERFSLTNYGDSAICQAQPPVTRYNRLKSSAMDALFLAVFGGLTLFSVVMWPVFLLLMAFTPAQANGNQQAAT